MTNEEVKQIDRLCEMYNPLNNVSDETIRDELNKLSLEQLNEFKRRVYKARYGPIQIIEP